MKKFFAAVVAVMAALVATAGFASSAQAYPELTFNLTAHPTVLYGGQTVTGVASANTNCTWSITWNNQVHHGSSTASSSFSTTWTAPVVTSITKIPMDGVCTYASSSIRLHAAGRVSVATATWTRTIVITVLPRGTVSPPVGPHLPNTGGPNLLFLLGGLALLLSGTTAVVVARRRAEDSDIVTGQA
jgi:LPXTG-motif cell wall-anchored protein